MPIGSDHEHYNFLSNLFKVFQEGEDDAVEISGLRIKKNDDESFRMFLLSENLELDDDVVQQAIEHLKSEKVIEKIAIESVKSVEKLAAFLECGIDVNQGFKTFLQGETVVIEDETLLHIAARNSSTQDVCEFLVESGATFSMNSRRETPFALSKVGSEARVFFAQRREKELKYVSDEYFPLSEEYRNEVLSQFYEALVRVNSINSNGDFTDQDLLNYAINKSTVDGKDSFAVEALDGDGNITTAEKWQLGRALNHLGHKFIGDAIDEKNSDLVQACLGVGVEMDARKFTALHYAASIGEKDWCEELLNNSANISDVTNSGDTPLHFAVLSGNKETVELLIASGADPFKKNDAGKAAFDVADLDQELGEVLAQEKTKRFGKYVTGKNKGDLLRPFVNTDSLPSNLDIFQDENDANFITLNRVDDQVEITDDGEFGYQLHHLGREEIFGAAVDGAKLDLLEACLGMGVSVNEKDGEGDSLLHLAIKNRAEANYDLLINSGADIFARDAESMTPLYYATQSELTKFTAPLRVSRGIKEHDLGQRKKLLEVFLKNHSGTGAIESELIECESGDYLVKKDGADFKVLRRDVAGGGGFVDIVDPWQISFALRDMAERDISFAASSGDKNLFQACLDAGASVDKANADGRTPLVYAKLYKQREISSLIAQEQKGPREKFQELARQVKTAYIAKKTTQEIQKVIDDFGEGNSDFRVDGLRAEDMIAFMQDITIAKADGQPDPSKMTGEATRNLLDGKAKEGSEDSVSGARRKSFYSRLLLTCLEDDHRFISSEHTDSIRRVVANNAQQLFAGEEYPDIAYSGLRAGKKNSVIDLYQRARFEEIRSREGLNENLTYEDFTRKLAEVVKVVSKRDDELTDSLQGQHLKRLEDEKVRLAEELKKVDVGANTRANDSLERWKKLMENEERGDEVEDLESVQYEDFFKKFKEELTLKVKSDIRKNEADILRLQSDGETLDQKRSQYVRALNALLGPDEDSLQKGKKVDHSPNRYLGIALDMMRREGEFTQVEILGELEERENSARSKIGARFRGVKSREGEFDLKEFEQAQEAIKTLDQNLSNPESYFFFDEDSEISAGDFAAYSQDESFIFGFRGDATYHGNTGLRIDSFDEGFDGLYKFSQQVEREASKAGRDFRDGEKARVAFAVIRDLPRGGGIVRDSFCIVTSDKEGVTTTFVDDINHYADRSEELYKENLEYITRRAGIEAAINVLIEARASMLPGGLRKAGKERDLDSSGQEEEIEFANLRKQLSKHIISLRKCLEGTEIVESDSDLDAEAKRKLLKANSDRLLEVKKGGLLELIEGGADRKTFNEENTNFIRNLLKGHSTEEQRKTARKRTSDQVSSEVAEKVKRSKEDNKYKFSFDAIETAEVVSMYQAHHETYLRRLDYLDLGGSKAFNKKGIEELIGAEMPHVPDLGGISIHRPRGYNEGRVSGSIVTVIFNGDGSDNVAWLALPSDCGQGYARVTRCREDGEISVYRNGKEVMEMHRAGDVVIDTGVSFQKGDDGVYTPHRVDKLSPRAQKAYNDFRVKAVSIDEGNRCSMAMLYGGHEVEMDLKLKQKSSPFQEADKKESAADPNVVIMLNESGVPVLKKPKDLTIAMGKDCNLVISAGSSKIVYLDATDGEMKEVHSELEEDDFDDEGNPVKIITANPEFKDKLTEKILLNPSEEDCEVFFDEVGKVFGEEFQKKLDQTLDHEEAAQLIVDQLSVLYQERLSAANKKFAVIDKERDFDLVLAVDPTKSQRFLILNDEADKDSPLEKTTNLDVAFLSPEIQFVEGGETKRLKIFNENPDGTFSIATEGRDKMRSLGEGSMRGLLSRIYTESEMRGFDLNDDTSYSDLCTKLRRYCNGATVSVATQQVVQDGFSTGEPVYQPTGEAKVVTLSSPYEIAPEGNARNPRAVGVGFMERFDNVVNDLIDGDKRQFEKNDPKFRDVLRMGRNPIDTSGGSGRH